MPYKDKEYYFVNPVINIISKSIKVILCVHSGA